MRNFLLVFGIIGLITLANTWHGRPKTDGIVVFVIDGADAIPVGQMGWFRNLTHNSVVCNVIKNYCPSENLAARNVDDGKGHIDEKKYLQALDDAVKYLAKNPKDRVIINLSLGSKAPNVIEERLVAELVRQGAIVVAAAGNDGAERVAYPAAYPGVIAVAASEGRKRADFSNFGERIDLAADGQRWEEVTQQIVQQHQQGVIRGRIRLEGTSFAAPRVAGTVFQILAHAEGKVNVQEVLKRSAKSIDDNEFAGGKLGAGLLDTHAALKAVRPLYWWRTQWWPLPALMIATGIGLLVVRSMSPPSALASQKSAATVFAFGVTVGLAIYLGCLEWSRRRPTELEDPIMFLVTISMLTGSSVVGGIVYSAVSSRRSVTANRRRFADVDIEGVVRVLELEPAVSPIRRQSVEWLLRLAQVEKSDDVLRRMLAAAGSTTERSLELLDLTATIAQRGDVALPVRQQAVQLLIKAIRPLRGAAMARFQKIADAEAELDEAVLKEMVPLAKALIDDADGFTLTISLALRNPGSHTNERALAAVAHRLAPAIMRRLESVVSQQGRGRRTFPAMEFHEMMRPILQGLVEHASQEALARIRGCPQTSMVEFMRVLAIKLAAEVQAAAQRKEKEAGSREFHEEALALFKLEELLCYHAGDDTNLLFAQNAIKGICANLYRPIEILNELFVRVDGQLVFAPAGFSRFRDESYWNEPPSPATPSHGVELQSAADELRRLANRPASKTPAPPSAVVVKEGFRINLALVGFVFVYFALTLVFIALLYSFGRFE